MLLTNNHPNGETQPRISVEYHHEVNIYKHTDQRQQGEKGNLQKKRIIINKML